MIQTYFIQKQHYELQRAVLAVGAIHHLKMSTSLTQKNLIETNLLNKC